VGFSHRKKRVTITADFSRGISSARETLADIKFIDPGKPIPPPILLPTREDEDFLEDLVNLGIALQGKRTRAAMNVRWSDREFEVSGDKEDALDLRLTVSRRLASGLSADFNVYWQHLDNDSNVDSESTLFSSFGLSKALGRRTSVGVSLSHRDEDDEGGGSSTENRIAINITTSFL
jgi:uncharacterized protein (PEP-CTERM system associated)